MLKLITNNIEKKNGINKNLEQLMSQLPIAS